ncbi:folic acid synthesis protein [Beauveria bassiana ARSEF 2860]|uniref:2-amino-4-hydroxy-6-hydroxymethyldihydropteridine diphosphokinase n=1 Tax=Beauveria bassiana (strain ARSEF 2860) TaxID=655819 RepID=J4KNH8_BEAB2|nr:folic acid synthesis protein [Beauveria bassiana ARSEF 2860]EJP65729.1 folic acid synthesis protein [Beauveria bassiana ARSEF 2860]
MGAGCPPVVSPTKKLLRSRRRSFDTSTNTGDAPITRASRDPIATHMTSIMLSQSASRALPRAAWLSAYQEPRAGAFRAISSRAAALLSMTACSRRASLKTPLLEASRSNRNRRLYATGCGCRGGKRTNTAYIALGGNLGDRVAEIERACNEMDRRGIKVTRTSSLWETEPMYVTDQDRFLNGVCEVETELQPMALLDELQSIERDLGRRKLIDKGPRNIDLDILLYGDERISNERLTIPHIGIPEREFVLRPLSELIPSQSIDPSKPWKLVQDYLNDLAAVGEPLSSVTRISASAAPLTPLTPNRTSRIMAILNLTPDSFSDGGRHAAAPDLSATILDMVRGGATIIDVGGQSTAPGRPEVTADEEVARVLPVVELIRSMPACRSVAVSVDTYRAGVAAAAVARGADMINDVSAGQLDAAMLPTVARLGATICLMHMRGTPRTMAQLADYPDSGDGGGGVTDAHNLELLRRLDELRNWPGLVGLPWLVGPSRKTFIGRVTAVEDPAARTWGTAAAVAAAVQGGADVLRVHDVEQMAAVAAMSDAIWRS